jgi:uncharacterized protein YozE (UPF0346 family)
MAEFVAFYEWLTKHKQVRTPVGELARELLKDQAFPREVATLEALLEYLRGSSIASNETLAKARIAWRAFVHGH